MVWRTKEIWFVAMQIVVAVVCVTCEPYRISTTFEVGGRNANTFPPEKMILRCGVHIGKNGKGLQSVIISNDNGYSVTFSDLYTSAAHCARSAGYSTPRRPHLYNISTELLNSELIFNKSTTQCIFNDGGIRNRVLRIELSKPTLPLLQRWRCTALPLDQSPATIGKFPPHITGPRVSRPTVNLVASPVFNNPSRQYAMILLSCTLSITKLHLTNVEPKRDIVIDTKFKGLGYMDARGVLRGSQAAYNGSLPATDTFTSTVQLRQFNHHSIAIPNGFVWCEMGGYTSHNRSYESLLRETVCFPTKSEPRLVFRDSGDAMLMVSCDINERCSDFALQRLEYRLSSSAESSGSNMSIAPHRCNRSHRQCLPDENGVRSLDSGYEFHRQEVSQLTCSQQMGSLSVIQRAITMSTPDCSPQALAPSLVMLKSEAWIRCAFTQSKSFEVCEPPLIEIVRYASHQVGLTRCDITKYFNRGHSNICRNTSNSITHDYHYMHYSNNPHVYNFTCRYTYPTRLGQLSIPFADIPQECNGTDGYVQTTVMAGNATHNVQCLVDEHACARDAKGDQRGVFVWSRTSARGMLNWHLEISWEIGDSPVQYIYHRNTSVNESTLETVPLFNYACTVGTTATRPKSVIAPFVISKDDMETKVNIATTTTTASTTNRPTPSMVIVSDKLESSETSTPTLLKKGTSPTTIGMAIVGALVVSTVLAACAYALYKTRGYYSLIVR